MANNTIKVLSEKIVYYELEKNNEFNQFGSVNEEIKVGGGNLMDNGRESH